MVYSEKKVEKVDDPLDEKENEIKKEEVTKLTPIKRCSSVTKANRKREKIQKKKKEYHFDTIFFKCMQLLYVLFT